MRYPKPLTYLLQHLEEFGPSRACETIKLQQDVAIEYDQAFGDGNLDRFGVRNEVMLEPITETRHRYSPTSVKRDRKDEQAYDSPAAQR
ncbi:hypothetical protein ONO23_00808 [Micromonospora noduli]|nr:hypothetical protein ONO23_00808 [Micromonospora noduli]